MRIGRAGQMRLTVALIIAIVGQAACVYPNPTVDLVVHVQDEPAGEAVRGTVADFAQARGLKPYREEGAEGGKTTHFLTGTRHPAETGFTYYDASPACKVVQVVEGSKEWTDASREVLAQLQAQLRKIPGVRVEPANTPENWQTGVKGIKEYCK